MKETSQYNEGRWSKEEHTHFIEGKLDQAHIKVSKLLAVAMGKFGNNWVKVREVVKTRSTSQIRSHA